MYVNLKYLTCVLFLITLFFILATDATYANNIVLSTTWDNNNLTIEAEKNIVYTEAHLKDPERLIVDILNCRLDNKNAGTNINTRLGEKVSISETANGNVRIVFVGEASINRKVYLSSNEKTLTIKIARINIDESDSSLIEENPNQTLVDIGEIKDLSVEESNNETFINISCNKSIKYNSYRLREPERLAIDLLNILPPKEPIPFTQMTSHISGIRIGNAASGIEATRIVVDFTDNNIDSDISSNLIGNKLRIKIKPTTGKNIEKVKSKVKVVIDPGHGGYDSGASYGGQEEKNITLTVSEKLKKYLEINGITVFLTREDDSFISLAERNEITNAVRPDVFISIHANALKTSSAIRGLETYYWTPQSEKFAYITHQNILKNIQIPNHYIRKARFYVIKYTSVPAILVEMGFMTNHYDRQLLTNSSTQDKYAKAIGDSILEFLELTQAKKEAE